MMVSDLKLISDPIVVIIDNKENEYEDGSAACAAIKSDNRLEVKSLSVRENKIVVQLAEWETKEPFNYVGEVAID